MSKVVVVSGGGSGIGAATAARFVEDGCRVIIVGRRADALERTRASLEGDIDTFAADLSDVGRVSKLVDHIRDRYGSVDVLINNAGGNCDVGSQIDFTQLDLVAASWIENFKLNVLTTVLLTEAIAPIIGNDGRVILTSSIAAYRGSSSGTGSYAAAKIALHPYVYDLAKRLGPRKITANVIAPGYVADTEFFGATLSDTRKAHFTAEMLTGEATQPRQVANLVAWLTSAEAGQITGQILQINGGAEFGR